MEKVRFEGNSRLSTVITGVAILGFIVQIIELIAFPVNTQQTVFMLLFSLFTVITLLFRAKSFTLCFLISTFTMVTTWRLSGLAGYQLSVYVFLVGILLKICSYIACAYNDIKGKSSSKIHGHHRVTVFEWQLLFIRLFIGLDLIPHFCEKLFAGDIIRMADVHDFASLGVPMPLLMVIIAGIMEFGGALSIACGVMTRLGAICLTAYLMVATYLGGHFSNGFIWASKGGGWEYPVLWSTLILSFAIFGAGDFSIDRILKDNLKLPMWFKYLMGGRTF